MLRLFKPNHSLKRKKNGMFKYIPRITHSLNNSIPVIFSCPSWTHQVTADWHLERILRLEKQQTLELYEYVTNSVYLHVVHHTGHLSGRPGNTRRTCLVQRIGYFLSIRVYFKVEVECEHFINLKYRRKNKVTFYIIQFVKFAIVGPTWFSVWQLK